jgi:hypothetical protein
LFQPPSDSKASGKWEIAARRLFRNHGGSLVLSEPLLENGCDRLQKPTVYFSFALASGIVCHFMLPAKSAPPSAMGTI